MKNWFDGIAKRPIKVTRCPLLELTKEQQDIKLKVEKEEDEYNNRCFAENEKKQKLRDDLQTRILTEEEMQEVMRYGAALFSMYYRDEIIVIQHFNEAICQQYRLRAIDKIQRELIEQDVRKGRKSNESGANSI